MLVVGAHRRPGVGRKRAEQSVIAVGRPVALNVDADVVGLYHLEVLVLVILLVELGVVAGRPVDDWRAGVRRAPALGLTVRHTVGAVALIVSLASNAVATIRQVASERLVEGRRVAALVSELVGRCLKSRREREGEQN